MGGASHVAAKYGSRIAQRITAPTDPQSGPLLVRDDGVELLHAEGGRRPFSNLVANYPLGPNIAVPRRTWVAPQRIAVSKSADMPMLR